MATKAKELTTEQATQAAAALPIERGPVYLEGQCPTCKAIPIKRQGGHALIVTCGRCGKVMES